MSMHNNEKIAAVIAPILAKNPDTSINDLCRAVKDARAGAVSKPLMANLRRAILRSFKQLVENPGRVNRLPGGSVAIEFHTNKVAPAKPDPEQLATERIKKAERKAEREAKWRARAADRELREWAEEREKATRLNWKSPNGPAPEAEREAEPAPEPVRPLEITPPPMEQHGSPSDPSVIPSASPPRRRRGNANERAARRAFLNELLDADPGAHPVGLMARLHEKFGGALDWKYVYETCRVARAIHGLPTLARRDESGGREGTSPTPLPVFADEPEYAGPAAALPGLVDEAAFAPTPEEDLAWLAQQAHEIMRQHSLVELVVTMTGKSGEWEFKVAPRVGRGASTF